jgi:maleylacetoacetate isomerase
MLKLYDFFRSSAAYRVRIALRLKQLDYQHLPIHLTKNGGDQFSPSYRAVNAQARVPTLDVDGAILTQSLAIIEYLDETHPQPAFLPSDALGRARARAMALLIACDIHPLNNLAPLTYLKDKMGQDEEAVKTWYRHWVETGLVALEALVTSQPRKGEFCMGERPGIADICLVPQIFNARRYKSDLSGCPTLVKIDAACNAMPEFAAAAPDRQPDAS